MMKRLSNISLCLVFVVTVASLATAAGCRTTHRQEVKTEVVVPEYVTRVFEAAGGRQAWMKMQKLEFDCVVTFYNADGTYYITEQHHQIMPWANSIQISATEPQGCLIWQLSDGQFSKLHEAASHHDPPTTVPHYCYAEAILNMMTTPVRFLDSNDVFTKRTSPVKRQGLWYYPIERTGSEKLDTKYDKVVFYQNTDSSLVDTICLVGTNQQSENRGIAVRGYDYRKVESNGVLVPGRIEIFKTDDRGQLRQRLVKIDYK